MNNDLISRSELKKAIEKEICNFELPISANEIMPIIDNAPTVESSISETYGVAYEQGFRHGKEKYERPQGEWVRITREGTVPVEYICSCCGRKIYDDYALSIPMSEFYPFCHCGADMRKEQNDDNYENK